ncbi:MAG TPA: hypothetical protein PK450_11575 [Paracoccaceae bacterium]|nr:hypothetical protein [Paracoccaceae bacterium]
MPTQAPHAAAPQQPERPDVLDRSERRRAALIRETGEVPVLADPKGHVVLCAARARGLAAKGKMNPSNFLPAFLPALARLGLQPHFAFAPSDIRAQIARHDATAIAIWNEEKHRNGDPAFREATESAGLLFNSFATGAKIARKLETNIWLSGHGIRMPPVVRDGEDHVFSNTALGSSQPVALVAPGDPIDPERYNTRYIDTRVDHEGRPYLTSVRLMAVGPHVVGAFVGARDMRWQRFSVHGVDTPMDAGLVNFLYDRLYLSRKAEFADIARRLHAVLGPGFYHHDLIVERDTDLIYLCEVGFKFDASAFAANMRPIAADVPWLRPFYTDEFASKSAEAFHACWEAARGG